jgi:hypothetical protein
LGGDLVPHADYSSWVTFVDRDKHRLIALCTAPIGQFCTVEHSAADSVPGEYDVWRERDPRRNLPEQAREWGDVRCVEIQLKGQYEPPDFPENLLDPEVVRRGSLLTVWSFDCSFLWRTWVGAKPSPDDDELTKGVRDFAYEVGEFSGFSKSVYRLGDLRVNTKWDWGFGHGVYCFTSPEGEVHYVGRSLGSTLGQRIWNQMQSQDDPEWKQVVTNDNTLVKVFTAVGPQVFMASAFEAYLIGRLRPRFNLRCQ